MLKIKILKILGIKKVRLAYVSYFIDIRIKI